MNEVIKVEGDALRAYWHPVAKSADVGNGKPSAARLLDERLVLYRAGAEVVAMQDLCIHRGTPLSLGWIEGENIVCAYHGFVYSPDGACVRIPSLPDDRGIPRKARVATFRAQERYGLVWVALDEPRLPVPEFPEYDDPRHAVNMYEFHWHANAARGIENVLDYTHFPWLHEGMLGDRSKPIYPEVSPHTTERGFTFAFDDTTNGSIRSYSLYVPFTLRIDVTPREAGRLPYTMLFTFCPLSSTETVQWFLNARTWNLDRRDLELEERDKLIFEQDQSIVEGQRPEALPLDLSAELHLRGTDAAALEYRRLLKALGVAWHQ